MDYKEWMLSLAEGNFGLIGCRFEGIITDWGEDVDASKRLYCRAYFEIVNLKKFEDNVMEKKNKNTSMGEVLDILGKPERLISIPRMLF